MPLDAVIVGGSFAGLSAAIYLARARRSVRVIDVGAPRNRFAAASHGFFSQDGSNPLDMIAAAHAQVAAYPSAEILSGEAKSARAVAGGFEIELSGGDVLTARKLVLAFGVSDVLPDVQGLRERWGVSVLHCPYCHGFEFADRPLGVLHKNKTSAHHAVLIAEWGPTTLFLDGRSLAEDERRMLAERGVTVEPAPILSLEGESRSLSSIALADGRVAAIDALYVATDTRLNSQIAEALGCALENGPFGPLIATDGSKETTTPGVYAAGDIARAPHSVAWASADGVTAGTSAHRALVFPAILEIRNA